MDDLAKAIMAHVKAGRTITFKPASGVVVHRPGAQQPDDYITIAVAAGNRQDATHMPFLNTNGRQLEDKDWIGLLQQMAERIK